MRHRRGSPTPRIPKTRCAPAGGILLGHEHLKVEDLHRGGGHPWWPLRWIALLVHRVPQDDAERKAERYEIRYKIGTADTAGQANLGERGGRAAGSCWLEARASAVGRGIGVAARPILI